MSRKNKKKAAQRILNDAAAIRGIERQEHFANLGTLEQWVPSRKVHTSSAQKRRGRLIDRKNSIKDSKESKE